MVVNSSQGGGSKDTWVLRGRRLMLSRIADSLFWIARYMERAEDTARILDVNYYMLLEGAQQPVPPALGAARRHQRASTSGSSRATPRPTRARCFEFLGFSEDNPNSIVQCVAKARENARTIRDRISREMWEDLNSLYLEVSRFSVDDVLAAGPHRFCNLVKSGSHRFHGRQPTPPSRATRAGTSCRPARRSSAPR